MKTLLVALVLTAIALAVIFTSRALAQDEQQPEDPFSGYIGFECAQLGDDAEPGQSSFSIDPNGTMLLQCVKHLWKAEWVQDDVKPAADTPVKTSV